MAVASHRSLPFKLRSSHFKLSVVAPRIELSAIPQAGVLPSAPVSDVCCRFRRRISSLSVGREALESSSAVLQTAARPSQLPAQIGSSLVSPVQFGHEKRPDVCVTSDLDERRFERSRRHMRRQYAGASLFDGVPPKRLPSHICSSRLDWNFDNMELSARL